MIREREHDAPAEEFKRPPLALTDDPRLHEICELDAALARFRDDPRRGRRTKAEPPGGDGALGEAALCQIRARRLPVGRLGEDALVEGGGEIERRAEPIALLTPLGPVERERHPCPLREHAKRFREAHSLPLHEPGEHVAADATPEAMKGLPRRAHHEARRVFLVEGAPRLEVRPRPLERKRFLDERGNIYALFHGIGRLAGHLGGR